MVDGEDVVCVGGKFFCGVVEVDFGVFVEGVVYVD